MELKRGFQKEEKYQKRNHEQVEREKEQKQGTTESQVRLFMNLAMGWITFWILPDGPCNKNYDDFPDKALLSHAHWSELVIIEGWS